MKSATRSAFPKLFPGVSYEWYIIKNPFQNIKPMLSPDTPVREVKGVYGSREVSKEDAFEYIEENGLVLTMKNKDGEIYDTPDGCFRERFRLDTKTKMENLEKIWGEKKKSKGKRKNKNGRMD